MLHEALLSIAIEAVPPLISFTITAAVSIQPLASVTVTLYVPEKTVDAHIVVCADGSSHNYV